MTDDLIHSTAHYPARWTIYCSNPLSGTVDVCFTLHYTEPDAAAAWHPVPWETPDETVFKRVAALPIAGSAVPGLGLFPGVGDWTAHVRYTDVLGAQRVARGGIFRFR